MVQLSFFSLKQVSAPVWQEGPLGLNFHQQSILVAIQQHINELQVVARRFAFGPEPLFGAAEEGNPLFAQGFVVSFLVHETQHERALVRASCTMQGTRPFILEKLMFRSFIGDRKMRYKHNESYKLTAYIKVLH